MDYQIVRFVNSRPTGDIETWKNYPLESVKNHAREIIDNKLAERVEIRDSHNTLVFQWPRTISPAPSFNLAD